MDATAIEKAFEKAVNDAIQKMKDPDYYPTRLVQSIDKKGTIRAVKDILSKEKPPSGFTKLLHKGKLEYTLEFLVLHPVWRGIFTYSEQQTAYQRIKDALCEATA